MQSQREYTSFTIVVIIKKEYIQRLACDRKYHSTDLLKPLRFWMSGKKGVKHGVRFQGCAVFPITLHAFQRSSADDRWKMKVNSTFL